MVKKGIPVLLLLAIIGGGVFTYTKLPKKVKDVYPVSPNITVFFTNPPENPPLDDSLVAKIHSQSPNEYLDVCLYGFDRDTVIRAILDAINHGVHVRFVGNKDGNEPLSEKKGDYYEGYFRLAEALDAKFPVEGKLRIHFPADSGFSDFRLINSSIMHNKFMLFTDRNNNKFLYTGTTNCTSTGFERNNNNSLLIRDSGIVGTYRQQFEYLLGITGATEVNSVVSHTIDNIRFDVLFAPNKLDGRSVMDNLIELVRSADESIHFMIFSFPHRDLNDLILSKHNAGIDVKGVFCKSQLRNSSEEYLAQRGVPCRIDGNNYEVEGHGGKLHHKTMILDNSRNDAVVVTGSFNWSDNANNENDENLLFIHSKKIAQIYMSEWNARWKEGTDVVTLPVGGDARSGDVIINEVCWMGSRKNDGEGVWQDEFIELKNTTGNSIDLSAWAIRGGAMSGKALLLSNCTIRPHSLLVIQTRVPDESAFETTTFTPNDELCMPNERLELILEDPDNTVIDYAGNGSKANDFAGYNGEGATSPRKSMARKEVPGDGRYAGNWFTSSTQANIDADYNSYTFGTPGEENSSGTLTFSALDVVFSEVAWAGTDISANDEWIELHNNTGTDVSLGGWEIGGSVSVMLSGSIPAGKHFLLERSDNNSVPDKEGDQIYTGSLSNSGGILVLYYNNIKIDSVGMEAGWAAGSSSPKVSMERKSTTEDALESNWKNGEGDIEGAQCSND